MSQYVHTLRGTDDGTEQMGSIQRVYHVEYTVPHPQSECLEYQIPPLWTGRVAP